MTDLPGAAQQRQIQECYDQVAEAYARAFFRELEQKPFDRLYLDRFAALVGETGRVCDMGCGPGEVAAYLHQRRVNVFGLDLSAEMICQAKRLSPAISFEQGDFFSLKLADHSLAGIAAFYAIVHFSLPEVECVLRAWQRVLQPGGHLLFSFHVGREKIHADDFLGKKVNVDYSFFEPDDVLPLLEKARLECVEAVVRYPYPQVEFASRRAYILARKPV